ncbi:hypothetical protein N7478_009296 [Penicillium angulare]|uniref:uncharacterized protein n=1 Tax=Penicillium angulare TaxID=116970 RepID=UPI0025407577|nr:uncharacterized protein N7478_009296 [Penicillium angulare]KAJ5266488.1 hypothetical protein N7478_009296 [Penicillium angulare]
MPPYMRTDFGVRGLDSEYDAESPRRILNIADSGDSDSSMRCQPKVIAVYGCQVSDNAVQGPACRTGNRLLLGSDNSAATSPPVKKASKGEEVATLIEEGVGNISASFQVGDVNRAAAQALSLLMNLAATGC